MKKENQIECKLAKNSLELHEIASEKKEIASFYVVLFSAWCLFTSLLYGVLNAFKISW